jgi:MFS family permease
MSATAVAGRAAPSRLARAAARANFAGALGTVLTAYAAPGSLLLTLFLKEFLHAAKWQIGLVMTMTYLGPTFEPPGAYLVERFGRRRRQFLGAFLVNRLSFFALAVVPWVGPPETARDTGIALVLGLVALTRVAAHLGNPAWWSWMADLVPERHRGRFFACRNQWSSAVAAGSVLAGLGLLQMCGGMDNRPLLSLLFGLGALFGTLDILLYFRVPEPPLSSARKSDVLRRFAAPFREAGFRRLIVGMGLWSFSANLVLPFLPLYQRGETLDGQQLGLGVSWLFFAVLNVLGSAAGALTSRHLACWTQRFGTTRLLLVGSGYLFINLVYLLVGPRYGWQLLVPVALLGGAANAVWTVAGQQLLLARAPRQDRSYYVSAYNFTNGWLMAGGPLLGGLLADRLPVLGWHLPGGAVCCYFHLLVVLATVGGTAALLVLARLTPDAAEPPGPGRPVPWTTRAAGLRKTVVPEVRNVACPSRS